jgi:uncharacterized protein involved in tolerance to divalent cations
MMAKDFEPNRLEASKELARELVLSRSAACMNWKEVISLFFF